MSKFKIYKFLLTVELLLFSVNNVHAQDTTYVDVLDFIETNNVRWVSQIPPLKGDVKKLPKGWLKQLIIGKDELTSFQKPISVIGVTPQKCIVFDQGNGTLFFAENDKLEIPKPLRKKEAYFPSLIAGCLLPDNSVIFTDSKLNMIFSLSEDRKQLKELNKDLTLFQPTGIAYSNQKNQIWVVETAKHQISVLNINGELIKTIGKRGVGNAEFNFPTSIWIDKDGIAYVVDALNYRIQIFDAQGNFISMFGENGNGTGYFARSKGIATDSHGNIYVVDALFHCIQIFDAKGNYLYQFGKQGSDIEEFWMPSGIFIDESDNIYIADSYNSRIQIFKIDYKQ